MLLLLLLCCIVRGQPVFPPFWQVGKHWRSYLGQPCPYRANPSSSVREALESVIAGQEHAIFNITEAIDAWWDNFKEQRHSPLVLILAGSTGVGKTEAANAIARGLLQRDVSTAEGTGKLPLGLVDFRGEHFIDDSNVTALRDTIRQRLASALYECAGHIVVLFDEVQKAHKPALTELLSLMQGTNSRILGMDASKIVVILTSDSGECFIDELGGLSRIGRQRFWEKLRRRLNTDFEEAQVKLGTLANSIVAFEPLTWENTKRILQHHLATPRLPQALREHLDDLEIEPEALNALASMAFVPFTSWRCSEDWSMREETTTCRDHYDAAGSGRGTAAAAARVDAKGHTVLGGGGGGDDPMSTTVCGEPCSAHFTCSSNGGARPVADQSSGPVKRLLRLLGPRGYVGQWLGNQTSPKLLRAADSEAAAAAAAAEGGVGGSGAFDPLPKLSIKVRVQAACNLSGIKTAYLCTTQGIAGAGLRVLRCLVRQRVTRGEVEECETAWEGALP